MNGDSVKAITAPGNLIDAHPGQVGLGWSVYPDRGSWRRFHAGLLYGATGFLMHLPARDGHRVSYAALLNTADLSGKKCTAKTYENLNLNDALATMMWRAVHAMLPDEFAEEAHIETIAHALEAESRSVPGISRRRHRDRDRDITLVVMLPRNTARSSMLAMKRDAQTHERAIAMHLVQ